MASLEVKSFVLKLMLIVDAEVAKLTKLLKDEGLSQAADGLEGAHAGVQ